MTTLNSNVVAITLAGALLALPLTVTAAYTPAGTARAAPLPKPAAAPPVPLPASGKPDEVFTVGTQLDGGMESWTYKWHADAGSWALVGYSYNFYDEKAR